MARIETITTDRITTVTIDAPPVNALAPDDWMDLGEVMTAASDDREVRAVVLEGTEGRFCAGADISILAEPQDEPCFMLSVVGQAAAAIRACRVPVIAAIDGPAHGGGLELALACDIKIASPRATFAASGINMGLIASVPSLAAAVGITRAKLMLLTGMPIDAAQAVSWSLASLLSDEPSQRAHTLARDIAKKAPLAAEANKLALGSVGFVTPEDHEGIVTKLFASLEKSADHKEAIDAFLNKRTPTFERG